MNCVQVFIVLGLLMSQDCSSRSMPEDDNSVVSVYTTQSTGTSGTIDVYHQIAHNIAERITMPIYRFFGIYGNGTRTSTTQRPWDKIELQDETDAFKDTNQYPFDNDISNDKDTEELSPEALHKVEQRPEKITLFSSNTPSAIENLDGNDTTNKIEDDDDTFGFEDVSNAEDTNKSRAPLIYLLEWLGSFIQLLYGGVTAFLSANKTSNGS